MQASGNTARLCFFSVVLSLATAGIALRLFNIKLPQLHAHHIVDKTASRTSSAPAVEQLLSNDLFVGAPCLGCSNLLRLLVEKNGSQMLLPFSDHETQLHLTLLARQPWLQARARQIEDCFGNTAGHVATFRRVWQCGAILVHECQFRLACLGAPKVQRVSCYTCWKHTSSRSCLQAWWKVAGRCGQECRLKGTGRRGWVAAGLQRRGQLLHAGKRHDADKPEISGQVWESAWGWGV